MQEHPTPGPRDERRLIKTRERSIYKRGNRYVVRFRVNGRERKRFAATLAEARTIRSQVAADVSRGEYHETSRMMLADYAAGWLDGYQGRTSRGIRATTLDEYRRVVEDAERGPLVYFGARRVEDDAGHASLIGGRKLATIRPPDVKAYVRSLVDAGLSTSTTRNFLTPLRAMLADAFEDGLIRVNPTAGIRVPAPDRLDDEGDHADQQVRALSDEQLAALIVNTVPEYQLLVRVLAATGLRIGEAVGLRWSDIDFGTRRVKVRRRFYRGTWAPPKSHYGRREVPLAPSIARALWDARKHAHTDDALVFPGRGGEPLAQSSAYRAVQAAGKAAGVPWAGPHTLRHTCGTLLFKSGANAKQVQLWLGHYSPAFTLATYVHLLPDDLFDPGFLDALVSAPLTVDPAERRQVQSA